MTENASTSTDPSPAAQPAAPSRLGRGAQRRHWTVLAVCVVLLVPLRCVSENRRAELQIKPRSPAEAAGLWETVSTSGAGPFRAFYNLFTWMQIGEAEDNREYYQLVDLYRTILRLQPRNVRIQRFLADQLMDTIAPNAADAESAWPWVREGKELLDKAVQRNPRAWDIHDALAYYWFRRMADYPIWMLDFEIARGEQCLFHREPAWQQLAEETLADFNALSADEQRAFRHAVSRIGFTLLYSSNLAEFSEFNQLSTAAQSVFQRCNQLRMLGEILTWDAALDPATGLLAREQPRAMRRFVRRVRDAASLSYGSHQQVSTMRNQVWQHAARVQQWMLDRVASGDIKPADLQFSTAYLREAWDKFPPEPGAVSVNGQPLSDSFFTD